MLEYDAKGTGWASEVVSTPTPSFSTILPTQVWRGTVSIGGSTVSNTVSGNIDLTRSVTPIYGIGATQDPYQIFTGALETTGKFTFVMENDSQLLNFLNNSQPAIVLNWNYGTGAAEVQLQATITKGAYTTAVIDRGSDFVQIAVDVNAMANTTDAGSTAGFAPIKWVLKNALVSGVYN
jgi:hypothetical protein